MLLNIKENLNYINRSITNDLLLKYDTVIDIITQHFIPKAKTNERLLYYYCIICEFKTKLWKIADEKQLQKAIEETNDLHEKILDISKKIHKSNPTKLCYLSILMTYLHDIKKDKQALKDILIEIQNVTDDDLDDLNLFDRQRSIDAIESAKSTFNSIDS